MSAEPATTPPPAEAVNPWERWGWAFASIWLVFLVYPIMESVQADAPGWARIASVACCVAFGVANVLGYTAGTSRAGLAVGAMAVLAAATIPVIGIDAVGFTPYLGMICALQLPEPWWKPATAVSAVLPLAPLIFDGDFPVFFFLMVWPIILAGVVIRLFAAREREAEITRGTLAIVAERERVARDVHDVLGHSLTALSVKAELAARLIDVDPERARAELESIQETARQALAEVRSTVGGLRAGNLETELQAAPRVLADAGVHTTIEGSVADTDPRHRTLLAWVLREAVTNVVRHAGASSVRVSVGPRGLVVTDDGRGLTGSPGNGLRGMQERVADAGGSLTLSDAGPGTRLEVVLG